jgi:hypothetical protein
MPTLQTPRLLIRPFIKDDLEAGGGRDRNGKIADNEEKLIMSRPQNKVELISAIQSQRAKLEKKIASLSSTELVYPGTMENWSVKDILAHLVDWEQRFIGWYQAGKRGETPKTPEADYKWRDLPALNQKYYEIHKDEPLEKVLADFQASYHQIFNLVGAMSEQEITQPGFYPWTGNSALIGWITANTSSHYNWAYRMIRPQKIRKGLAG